MNRSILLDKESVKGLVGRLLSLLLANGAMMRFTVQNDFTEEVKPAEMIVSA
jgi:hypothetical protein